MNISTETSIRALQKYKKEELRKILDEYHARCKKVDERIEEIRKDRGTKIKPADCSDYREAGRSVEYDNLGRRLY